MCVCICDDVMVLIYNNSQYLSCFINEYFCVLSRCPCLCLCQLNKCKQPRFVLLANSHIINCVENLHIKIIFYFYCLYFPQFIPVNIPYQFRIKWSIRNINPHKLHYFRLECGKMCCSFLSLLFQPFRFQYGKMIFEFRLTLFHYAPKLVFLCLSFISIYTIIHHHICSGI